MADQDPNADFKFPKNLHDLSWEEREKLAEEYLRWRTPHPNAIELSPSKVLLPESLEFRALKLIKANPAKYRDEVPGVGRAGYVGFNPPTVIRGAGVGGGNRSGPPSPEMVQRAMKDLIHQDIEVKIKAYRDRLANMGPVERAVEERFGDL